MQPINVSIKRLFLKSLVIKSKNKKDMKNRWNVISVLERY